ncbi:MAG: class I SAM-dependent methyltransferase [Candidatus Micrarchaeales archaeon]|nr:class I SAM-dependent methyltransferase [Candidatus Micrarchaeales archaeon]
MLNSCYKSGNYDVLYARYLKNASQLTNQIRIDRRMSYVDLCGGTGAVSRELVKKGAADITVVDLNRNMLKHAPVGIKRVVANAEEWKPERRYDAVFCRQAITYLNLERLEKVIDSALKPSGVFVFNLICTEKSTIASFDRKAYELNGKRYQEMTLILFGRAYHFQHSEKDGIDLTSFRMYGRSDIKSAFRNWDINVNRGPKAMYFVLRRKRKRD